MAAASLELPARRTPVLVDLARVGLAVGAEMYAATVGSGRESIEAEVSRLDLERKIDSADPAPTQKIGFGNEQAAVFPAATARPAA